MKVYLDDERKTPDGYFRVVRAEEVISLLKLGLVTHLSLDHDLGDFTHDNTDRETRDGSWLTNKLLWMFEDGELFQDGVMPKWNVHSANPVGVKRMTQDLKELESKVGHLMR